MNEFMPSAPKLVEKSYFGPRISPDYLDYLQEVAPGLKSDNLDSIFTTTHEDIASEMQSKEILEFFVAFWSTLSIIASVAFSDQHELFDNNFHKLLLTPAAILAWAVRISLADIRAISKAEKLISHDINDALRSDGVIK